MENQNKPIRINLLVSNEGYSKYVPFVTQKNGVIRKRRNTPKRRQK
jgi:hypothetical protein